MTWYSYRNFGTVLQAYALAHVLESLGCDAKDVAYDPLLGSFRHEAARPTLWQRVVNKARWRAGYRPVVTEGREKAFDEFIGDNLKLTAPVSDDERFAELDRDFDCFVCGSDQVWSPRCFDPRYYLDFVTDGTKKVAYAPSFGCDSLSGFKYAGEIASLLKGFGAIGVRESSGADIVEGCTGRRPEVVLDPTLLLRAEDWDAIAKGARGSDEGPYCLFYFLGTYRPNRRAAMRIARACGLRVVEVPVFQRDLRRPEAPNYTVGPMEFVSLVKGADLVCTDSFHGMAFSATFGRPLVAFERFDPRGADSQNTRVYSFLDMAGMRDALLDRPSLGAWGAHVSPDIDYRGVVGRLQVKREESLSFLRRSLEAALGASLVGKEN